MMKKKFNKVKKSRKNPLKYCSNKLFSKILINSMTFDNSFILFYLWNQFLNELTATLIVDNPLLRFECFISKVPASTSSPADLNWFKTLLKATSFLEWAKTYSINSGNNDVFATFPTLSVWIVNWNTSLSLKLSSTYE